MRGKGSPANCRVSKHKHLLISDKTSHINVVFAGFHRPYQAKADSVTQTHT